MTGFYSSFVILYAIYNVLFMQNDKMTPKTFHSLCSCSANNR